MGIKPTTKSRGARRAGRQEAQQGRGGDARRAAIVFRYSTARKSNQQAKTANRSTKTPKAEPTHRPATNRQPKRGEQAKQARRATHTRQTGQKTDKNKRRKSGPAKRRQSQPTHTQTNRRKRQTTHTEKKEKKRPKVEPSQRRAEGRHTHRQKAWTSKTPIEANQASHSAKESSGSKKKK